MVTIKLDRKLCKKCGICVDVCPVDVYSFDELKGPVIENEDECIACNKCVLMCPDFSIKVIKEEKD